MTTFRYATNSNRTEAHPRLTSKSHINRRVPGTGQLARISPAPGDLGPAPRMTKGSWNWRSRTSRSPRMLRELSREFTGRRS